MIPEALTRHFYVLEEVIAGLRAACIAGRAEEAAFWLQELIDSEEVGQAVAVLVETHLLYYGVRHLGWLKEAHTCFEAEDIGTDELHAACADLCSLKQQDHSLVALHLIRLQDLRGAGPPDFITVHPPTAGLLGYYMAALRQGKVRAAFWAAAGLTEQQLDTATNEVVATEPERQVIWKIVCGVRRWACINFGYDTMVALSLMVIAAPIDGKQYNFKGRHLWQEQRAEWAAQLGRRGRRLIQPHWSAFYLETRRGRMSYGMSTISELRALGQPGDTIQRLAGCTYWRELMDEIQMSYPDPDDAWEKFCGRAFPDDTPDEWSAADQLKSHGPGMVGQATCNANVAKWLGRFNMSTAYYTYGVSFKDLVPSSSIVPPEVPWSAVQWLAGLKALEPAFVQPEAAELEQHKKLYITPAETKADDDFVMAFRAVRI